MSWQASAPSNIALIKYMGKIDSKNNVPSNSSVSYTLENLLTTVQLEKHSGHEDLWRPLEAGFELSARGQEKYLRFFSKLKAQFEIHDHFLVKSHNNFPSDCGIASSASSFAALTKAAATCFTELSGRPSWSNEKLAELSRQGSGSSCRSFFAPWSLWDEQGARGVNFPWENLLHMVVVVEANTKKVSSSEAHLRVTSSLLFLDRPMRAEKRLAALRMALEDKKWDLCFEIMWSEFWDMHALFETSQPSFSYMTPQSLEVLGWVRQTWDKSGDGPLVTMDAGPNVHLFFRPEQLAQAQSGFEFLKSRFEVLCGSGSLA